MTNLEKLARKVVVDLEELEAQLAAIQKRSERKRLNQRRFMLERLHRALQKELEKRVARGEV